MAIKGESDDRFVPDLLKMKYEYLFKTIGRDGKYSIELKCLFLVLILYVPGLITTSFEKTLFIYVFEGWRHFASTVIIGIVVWLLLRFLKRMEEKIQQVDHILSPYAKEKSAQKEYLESKSWDEKIEKFKGSARVLGIASSAWYYFQAIGVAFGAFIFSLFVINPEVGWVLGSRLNEVYLRSWYVSLGFVAGASLHFIWGGFWIIRTYCKDVVSDEEIVPLDPDRTGGLRELGRLALDLDLIVALPVVAFPLYFLRELGFWDLKTIQLGIGLSILYALVLVFVFFVSISPAHDDMVKAKTKYLLKIHSEYKDMHKKLLHKLDTKQRIEPKDYNRLSGLYELYDRVESMAVWPLDFRTILRFAITSTAPLISVAISIRFSWSL